MKGCGGIGGNSKEREGEGGVGEGREEKDSAPIAMMLVCTCTRVVEGVGSVSIVCFWCVCDEDEWRWSQRGLATRRDRKTA